MSDESPNVPPHTTSPTDPKGQPSKYRQLFYKLNPGASPDAPHRERLAWLLEQQRKDSDPNEIRNPGQRPWITPSIYPDKIAEILGIEVERVNSVCDRAKLTPHMNDARDEIEVRQLKDKWDNGDACDVVDVMEAATLFRTTTQKIRQLLADNGVRPLNTHQKPYLYPRAEVLSLMGTVGSSAPVRGAGLMSRAEARARIKELGAEREARIAGLRVEYEALIREVMVEAGMV